jgi:acetyltransferase-like isoleucine patch superfamily enzyme
MENGVRRFHELVLINGNPEIGEGTRIGIFSEVYDMGGIVEIGRDCDIASFVSINCACSAHRTLQRSNVVDRKPIRIGSHVFIGSHSFIGGGSIIGDYCVVAAGTIARRVRAPDYSLIFGNPAKVKRGHYAPRA